MGISLENRHKLNKHPEIQDWFDDALAYLATVISPTIDTIKDQKQIKSNLVATIEPAYSPWPQITCSTWNENTRLPLESPDFTLITFLSRAIANMKIHDRHFHPQDFRPGIVERKHTPYPIYEASFRLSPHMKSFPGYK